MKKSFDKVLDGYHLFRDKYAHGDQSVMRYLSHYGQQPRIMVVACCDSRVDPALILQCDPGDLFVVRNVANIVPPYEKDGGHHGTSAALEFGVNVLNVEHLILLGHSQCGGIQALISEEKPQTNDFISNWVSVVETCEHPPQNVDEYAKVALQQSYQHCMTFPWIRNRIEQQELVIHRWFFDIQTGRIFVYTDECQSYQPLE